MRNKSPRRVEVHPDPLPNIIGRYFTGKATPLDRRTKIIRQLEARRRNRKGGKV